MLARLIHVHVKTLHAAARDGRLRVTYDTRTTFHSLRARATVADADTFLHTYFEKAVWPKDRPAPLRWSQIPSDFDDQSRRARRSLGLTQAQFAARVGAACKAVVCQWESRRRCPSPLFWHRIEAELKNGPFELCPSRERTSSQAGGILDWTGDASCPLSSR
jgi:ribosome-binding protein aMBF1 (putative translation factor)